MNGTCVCDPCYTGYECDSLCSGKGGVCVKDTCDCGFSGGRGVYCEEAGCPGYDEDCTGHGDCNKGTGECVCYTGTSTIYFILVTDIYYN